MGPEETEKKLVYTDHCPTCNADFATKRQSHELVEVRDGEVWKELSTEDHLWIVCAQGHSFTLTMERVSKPRFAVIVREPPSADTPLTERLEARRHAEAPCMGCGGSIQPGQMWRGSPKFPRHIGC